MNYWYQFAIMFEALFILTTIDAGTRVARYILQEMLGSYVYPPLKQAGWWPGILVTSGAVSFCWGYLLYKNEIATIWPLFGVANQLLAVVALALSVTVILKLATKKAYVLIAAIPLAFLSVTVIAAGVMNIFSLYLPMHTIPGMVNAWVSGFLVLLVIITLVDSLRKWIELLKNDKPVGLNTEHSAVCQFGETELRPNIPS